MGYKPFSNYELQDWQNFNCKNCQNKDGCTLIDEVNNNNIEPYTWEEIGGADAHRKEINPTIWRCKTYKQSTKSKQNNLNLARQELL